MSVRVISIISFSYPSIWQTTRIGAGPVRTENRLFTMRARKKIGIGIGIGRDQQPNLER